jgi:tetratricopeptide (TPR) repeat protein
MRGDRSFSGRFFYTVLIICAIFPAAYAQDAELSEIQYQEDYERLQKIAAVTQPVKRADQMVKFYSERPRLDPKLRAYADNLFARDLESLMKQENFIALRGLCERALKIRPKFGEVYLFMGVVLRREKKTKEAMDAFARCYVTKNPLQKKAKELLDVTYRTYNKGSYIGQEKIIKKAMQDMK